MRVSYGSETLHTLSICMELACGTLDCVVGGAGRSQKLVAQLFGPIIPMCWVYHAKCIYCMVRRSVHTTVDTSPCENNGRLRFRASDATPPSEDIQTTGPK